MSRAKKVGWTNHEVARLRSIYETDATPEEIQAALPRHNIQTIRAAARNHGLKRPVPQTDDLHPLVAQLRDARISQKLNKVQLGSKMGCHRTFLVHAERGRKNPTLARVERWAEALGMKLVLVAKNGADHG